VLHGSRAASAGRPILTITSNRRNYAHARNCLSSTSRAAFTCLEKYADPPTSGCTRFIRRLYAARMSCSVAPAFIPRISRA